MPARRRALPTFFPAAACALLALLALVLPGSASAASCAGADAVPGAVPAESIAASTLCLINGERASAGLPPLRAQGQLADAAARHASDMVSRQYFSHVSPEGGVLADRLTAAGWMPADGAWAASENIGWGSGALATPASVVDGWMNSDGHRRNILDAQYDTVGIGVIAGAPAPAEQPGGTYVTDFGSRGSAGSETALAPAAAGSPAAAAPAAGSGVPSGTAVVAVPSFSPPAQRSSAAIPAGSLAPSTSRPRSAKVKSGARKRSSSSSSKSSKRVVITYPARDAKRVTRCIKRVKRTKRKLTRSAALKCVKSARSARLREARLRAARLRAAA